jgi:hypothetical protein
VIALAVMAILVNPDPTETRAIEYLAKEVPAWRAANGCFSCHNNGDGVRALIAARDAGAIFDASILEQSLDWLREPSQWHQQSPAPQQSDQNLARIQFASALSAATVAGLVPDPSSLPKAAEMLAADQDSDGSFHPDGPESLGGPTTYGRSLSTWTVIQVLRSADEARFRSQTTERSLTCRGVRSDQHRMPRSS